MPIFRIALANIRYPSSPEESVKLAIEAINEASVNHAEIICFPEAYIPGYRGLGKLPPPPEHALQVEWWKQIADAAREAKIAVVLGTERVVEGKPMISVLVIDKDGNQLGFQDKGQLDPSEEETYIAGDNKRKVFEAGELRFGISICHEGFRYPESVRAAAQQGAHIVFHPHYATLEEGAYQATTFADPLNTFHEKAMLCRAAENTCYIATVNYCSPRSETTSAVIDPDGKLMTFQPYGVEGILYADIDTSLATGFLAKRLKQHESASVEQFTVA
jgi:predicted amidohydrolase